MTIRELWRERFGIDAPRKIVCVGLNYRDHAAEGGRDAPVEPLLFAKLSTALIEPGEPIVLPPEADACAITVGTSKRKSSVLALEHVAGYTVANDVSARTLQRKDGQWLRAKSFDTMQPGDLVEIEVERIGVLANPVA